MLDSNSNIRRFPIKRGLVKNLTGQRFGRLFVIALDHIETGKPAFWLCLCDCGQFKVINGKHLRQNRTKSCGCLVIETSAKANYKHGCSSKEHPHKYIYDLWLNIRSRILDPTDISYPTYGGSGIPMEDEWKTNSSVFITYILTAIGERPSRRHSIDRIVNELGYVKGNLRWRLPHDQNRNKTTNYMITANEETLCITDWAKRLGRSPRAIKARIERFGWTPENAVTSNSKNE